MTHYGYWFTGGKEGLDQFDGVLVFGEIPHRAMAAWVEDCVETFLLDDVKANGFVKLSFRSRVLLESDRKVSAELGFVALGVKRRSAALRGRERNLSPRIFENEVGRSELFEPEARLSAGVTQLIVGCDDHEYLHDLSPLLAIIE
jgi:hypothetical protein